MSQIHHPILPFLPHLLFWPFDAPSPICQSIIELASIRTIEISTICIRCTYVRNSWLLAMIRMGLLFVGGRVMVLRHLEDCKTMIAPRTSKQDVLLYSLRVLVFDHLQNYIYFITKLVVRTYNNKFINI